MRLFTRCALTLTILAALGISNADPDANAQVLECQVTGVMIIIAIDSAVTICSVNTDDPNTNNLTVQPHLFGPAPGPLS